MTKAAEFTPTPEQETAIGFPQQPLRIIAGAGTGKTAVLVERIAHLVDSGVATPAQVLGLTFTNKAAAELKQRVDRRLGHDCDVKVTTYHCFGAGLVADHVLELNLHPKVRLLDRAEAWQLLFQVFDEFRFVRKRVFRPGLVVNDALTLASRCADHLVEIDVVAADAAAMAAEARWKDVRNVAQNRLELCQVVEAYGRQKRRQHYLDFDDQIRLAVNLLRANPALAVRLATQRPVVLLDEYQDTNFAQRALLQLIYGTGSVITAVGDDMQSIYAFRGAHLRNILEFGTHFPPPGETALTENRRSGDAIVALANRIQSQVGQSVPKELRPRPGAPGAVAECFLAADDAKEAATIAADIVACGPPWAERAVLCRKRRLIPAVAAALERASVPIEVIGSSGLLDRPEVIDLVAWLEVLADPSSSVALLRLLEGPRYRLGRRDLAVLARWVRERNRDRASSPEDPRFELVDAVAWAAADSHRKEFAGLSDRGRSRLGHLAAQWEELSRAARRVSVVELVELVAERTGLWRATGPRGHENLVRFLGLAAGFQPVEGVPGVAAFVDYLRLLDESEVDLAEAHLLARDAVPVCTIHQAKGLEWDQVWIPGLAGSSRSRIFPDERGGDNALTKQTALPWWLCDDDPGYGDWRKVSKDSIDKAVRLRARDEEWRLLYVAVTRARHRVVLSAAHWYPGPAVPQGPSEFYAFVASQRDLVTERFRDESAAENPKVVQMRARSQAVDANAARQSAVVSASSPPAVQARLFEHTAAPGRSAGRPPATISVTELISFRRCPRQYYWLSVQPLPRRHSAAAARGSKLHRWIEQQALLDAAPSLFEPAPDWAEPDWAEPVPADWAEPEPADWAEPVPADWAEPVPAGQEELVAADPAGRAIEAVDNEATKQSDPFGGEPKARPSGQPTEERYGGDEAALEGLREAFRASPYGSLMPVRVEAPFVLGVGDLVVRGRVDAAYQREGELDVVDFKTGRPPATGDPGARVQLDTYAIAAAELWHQDPARMRTTYCYLNSDGSYQLVGWSWDPARVAVARQELAAALRRLRDASWPAAPGAWCAHCEWRPLCRAGRAFLESPGKAGTAGTAGKAGTAG